MSEYIIKTTNMPEHIREAISTWYEIDSEIVRCRDCRLQDEFKYCERLGFKVGDNGYCAWPKRRDEC